MRLIKELKSVGLILAIATASPGAEPEAPKGNNPVFPGWYADPEGLVFDQTYWIYPTFSAPYEKQTFFDAFSSQDLVHWTKHERILGAFQGGEFFAQYLDRGVVAPRIDVVLEFVGKGFPECVQIRENKIARLYHRGRDGVDESSLAPYVRVRVSEHATLAI